MVNPFKKVFNFLCSDNLRKICIYGSYCFCSVAQSCPILATPWTIVCQASLSFAISWSLLNLMSIESVMPSNHLVLSSPSPLALQLAQFRVFPNMLALHIRWPKYWSFSFSISPSNEYSESISFRINWFDLLAVQETLKSLLQHHSSKPSFFVNS